MFSQEERCIYRNNQLAEVVCQLRFPTILSVGANDPVEFQDGVPFKEDKERVLLALRTALNDKT